MDMINLTAVTIATTTNLVAKQDRTVAGDLAKQPIPHANLSFWQPMLPRYSNQPPMGRLLEPSVLRAGRLAAVSGSFAGSCFGSSITDGTTASTTTLRKRGSKSSKRRSPSVNGTVVFHSTDRHRRTVNHDYQSHDHRDVVSLASRKPTRVARMTTATTTVGK